MSDREKIMKACKSGWRSENFVSLPNFGCCPFTITPFPNALTMYCTSKSYPKRNTTYWIIYRVVQKDRDSILKLQTALYERLKE